MSLPRGWRWTRRDVGDATRAREDARGDGPEDPDGDARDRATVRVL